MEGPAILISRSGISYQVYDTARAVARAAAETWAEQFDAARDRRQPSFSVALSGGSTPKLMHETMASELFRDRVDWGTTKIYWGDERSVGPNHAESNFGMARETLLAHVPVPPENIHRMRGEADDLNAEAARYAELLGRELDRNGGDVPVFDLIFLGMGPDGHTASLFPGTAALDENELWVAANDVPQHNTNRLTLTFPVLNAARMVLFLVTGESKAEKVAEIFNAAPGEQPYPAARVRPVSGDLIWLLDREAASKL